MLRINPTTRSFALLLMTLCMSPLSARAQGVDEAHRQTAEKLIRDGIAFLRTTQSPEGAWSPKPGPAITALALTVFSQDAATTASDAAAQKALAYILSKARPDGGIHEGLLENYNTAICLSALSKITPAPQPQLVGAAQKYLRDLQWSNQPDPAGKTIDASHPFYGGAGYGKDGRPDMSNTQTMLQALHDSGLPTDDPAYQRALVFITRCQGVPQNTDNGSGIKNDGGFIYATSLSKDKIGQLESKAGQETIDIPGKGPTNVLRTYGSMTYAGFKSYLYAKLDRNDPRVVAAYDWVRNNYTLEQNPGMPEAQKLQGYYYYLLTFSRALRAWGEPTLTTTTGQTRYWANDLIDTLAKQQKPDGSWVNSADRWMEGDPSLTTAYALLALQEALR